MPTLPAEPVVAAGSPEEAKSRDAALGLVNDLIEGFAAYAYGTRSYMPHKKDYTDSTDGWYNLREFARARPDWTLEIVQRALKRWPEGLNPRGCRKATGSKIQVKLLG